MLEPEAAPGPVEAEVLRELRQSPAAAEVTTAAAGGCPGGLRVLRAGRARPGGGQDFVVLLHGRGHAAAMWFPLLPELAARHPVLAFDLPGFGASSGRAVPARGDGPEQALAFFVEPIEDVLRALGPAARFSLVGHSLGGLVALELALRGRVHVSRLALVDAMGLGPEIGFAARCFFRLHPERLARALGRRLFGRINPPPSPPTALGRRVAALEHELLVARPDARRAAARAFDRLCPLSGPAFHRRERLSEVAAPVLLLWGARDRALPVANAEGAHARLASSAIVSFPDLGHSPHLEAPASVLPELLRFL